MPATKKPKAIPRKMLKPHKEWLWGEMVMVTPAPVAAHFGDGKLLLRLCPIAHRPNYYLVRIDSSCVDDDKLRDTLDEIYETIEEEYGCEDQRIEWAEEDLKEQGIADPTYEQMHDYADKEWGMYFPVANFDTGSAWAIYKPGEW